jgi:hypothetical protein
LPEGNEDETQAIKNHAVLSRGIVEAGQNRSHQARLRCDGAMNAWYDDEVITVCYELLADILKSAPAQDLPIGVSRADTVIGPVLAVFLHETGHAVFNMLQIPVLGREEDAARFDRTCRERYLVSGMGAINACTKEVVKKITILKK